MAKKNKYKSLASGICSLINNDTYEANQKLVNQYFENHLVFSEEYDAFNEAINQYSSIAAELEAAKEQWVKDQRLAYLKQIPNKSLTWNDEQIIEAKIALFTDEQLSNLTIEELASLVRP